MWLCKSSTQRAAEYKIVHAPQGDADFVRGCDLPAHPHASAIALGVRSAVAQLGEIDSAFIRAEDTFDDDLVNLSFWGSLDTIGVVLALEENLGLQISDDEAQHLRNPELSKGTTVADFVRDVFNVVSEKLTK